MRISCETISRDGLTRNAVAQTLIIMVKEPRAGRVKTRLGRDIGMTASAWWFRHQVRRMLRNLQDTRWKIVLSVSPDNEGMHSRSWPKNHLRMPQGAGDIGARMARALGGPHKGRVVLIGGDIPDITKQHIAAAFIELGRNRAVFGPATDGGFWLVGLNRYRPFPCGIFLGVRWSTKHALADTIATLPDVAVGYVETLQDIDTAADLKK